MSERAARTRTRGLGIAAILFLVALALRLTHSLITDGLMWDELLYSLPTLREIGAGGFPIYAVNAAYMAPVQEWVSTALFAVFGVSYLTFRLPCVAFSCMAVAVTYLALRRTVSPRAALGLGLLLACANSGTTTWTSFSYPTWGFGLLLVALLQFATLWLHDRRTPVRWIAFGALCGFSLYVFKLSQVQILVSLAWLFFRSHTWRALMREVRENAAMRRRWWITLALIGAGLLPLAAVMYHYLTRVLTFTPGKADLLLAGAAVVLFGVAAVRILSMAKPPLHAWRNAALMAIALLLVSQPPMLYYSRVVRPRLEADAGKQWDAAVFSLKHAHQWPSAASIWLEGAFPSLLIGDADRNYRGPVERLQMGWRSIISIAFSLAVVAGIAWRRRSAVWRVPHRRLVILGPFILITALLFPSSNLSSGWSFRYLLPFYAGLLMLAFLAARPLLIRWPRAAAAFVVAFAIFGGVDSLLNTPKSHFDRRSPELLAEELPPNAVPRMAELPVR
jgi:hypothetical protein